MSPRTMFEKIWDAHVVKAEEGQPPLLYIDLHLVHEVTSPQAFEGLRLAGRSVRRPELTIATMDHNVPTAKRWLPITDPIAARQVEVLAENAAAFGVELFDLDSPQQGIVHVIGPELGLTLPGKTIVCGDSHTSTHGAFGALAFGIGTSEVEHVLATQTLRQWKPKTMEVRFTGQRPPGVTAKDMIMGLIGQIGTDGGQGYVLEYTGEAVRQLSMDQRMTLCNMSIEAGARAGMIAPDETTYEYLRHRPRAPKGTDWDEAIAYWRQLPTDPGAVFDRTVEVKVDELAPLVTWGTNPGQVVAVDERVPDPAEIEDPHLRQEAQRALDYMALEPGTPITEISINRVFIGSCTNARLSDLAAAAAFVEGRRVAPGVQAMVVPGSQQVKAEAEAAGLDKIFIDAGFEWRDAGCSMCLGMNDDIMQPGERSASTSNRNFEGRQGRGARTHLVSPEMAAAAAIAGHFVDIRQWAGEKQREGSAV